jgi:uncharacterized protein YkwD
MQSAARILFALSLMGAILFTSPLADARPPCNGATANPSSGNLGQLERSTLCLINAQRRARGLAPLHSNQLLHLAALRHSREMVRSRYFDHTSPSGVTFDARIRQTGYLRGAGSWSVGENIAFGEGPNATPRAIVRSWMNSPPHRHAILSSSFRSVGVGVALGNPSSGDGGATYTTDFGSLTRTRGHPAS